METHIPYKEAYPHLENQMKLGAKIRIEKAEYGKCITIFNRGRNAETITKPYLSNALDALDNFLSGETFDDYTKQTYPLAGDVFDMCIFKGRSFDLFYSLEDSTFMCISTLTPEILAQTRHQNDCAYGTGCSLLEAMTNCFVSPHYELRCRVED